MNRSITVNKGDINIDKYLSEDSNNYLVVRTDDFTSFNKNKNTKKDDFDKAIENYYNSGEGKIMKDIVEKKK